MGRPRLSVKRDQQFGVRLTGAEALAIAAAAGRRGMPPVAFIRSAALEAAGASVAAAFPRTALRPRPSSAGPSSGGLARTSTRPCVVCTSDPTRAGRTWPSSGDWSKKSATRLRSRSHPDDRAGGDRRRFRRLGRLHHPRRPDRRPAPTGVFRTRVVDPHGEPPDR